MRSSGSLVLEKADQSRLANSQEHLAHAEYLLRRATQIAEDPAGDLRRVEVIAALAQAHAAAAQAAATRHLSREDR